MRPPNDGMRSILLLDFDREAGLADALLEVLGSSHPCELEVRRIPLSARDLPLAPAWNGGLEGADPAAALLLVLSPPLLAAVQPLLESLRQRVGQVPVIAVLPRQEPNQIVSLLDLGVHDFLLPPFRSCDVLPRLWRLLGRAAPPDPVAWQQIAKLEALRLIGDSPSFVAAAEKLPLVARCDATVLISGETGTGKELFARSIHYLSRRANKPFVAVNCGAIPTELVENELFGHQRAAYTGAGAAHAGLIEEAEGGSLLLDEIDSLPLLAQVKLLRFLQEKEYRPLGAARACRADVRVLAATNGDMDGAVAAGRLRQDLFYRLNVIPLRLPPLRERRSDIPLLVRHFLAKHGRETGRPAVRFSPRAMQSLMDHDWPGNVRELEHVVERAVVLTAPGATVDDPQLGTAPPGAAPEGFQQAKARAVAQFEAGYIRGLLLAHAGNIAHAAKAADKNRRAFWELIRKHRIDAQSFRQPR
jgi:two-component system response regulator GlrR